MRSTPSRDPELARDTTSGRIGEITHIRRKDGLPVEVWLRPVGGGIEWPVDPRDVERIPRTEDAPNEDEQP